MGFWLVFGGLNGCLRYVDMISNHFLFVDCYESPDLVDHLHAVDERDVIDGSKG
jgi:hypothetical protein